jgi:peptide/nickel transport system permease protein
LSNPPDKPELRELPPLPDSDEVETDSSIPVLEAGRARAVPGSTTGKVSVMVAGDLEAEMTALLEESNEGDDLTYGDIVWGQFKKNKVAHVCLWGLGVLLALATYAPVLASTRPFYWSLDGEVSFPWVASLFDRNFFENPVDLFFNLLMVLGTPMLIGWVLRVRTFAGKGLRKRPRRRKMLSEARRLVLAFVAVFLLLLFTLSGSEYRQYANEQLVAQTEGTPVTAIYPPVQVDARMTGFSSLEKPRAWTAIRLSGKGDRGLRRGGIEDEYLPLLNALKEGGGLLPVGDPAIKSADPALLARAVSDGLISTDPAHILGVDQSTRDVAVRLLFGTRISLTIGVIAVSIYVTIGVILGSLAGFFGGAIDIWIQRIIEITMALPTFFVIITLAAFLEEPSIFHIMLIIGAFQWTGVARLTRGEFLRLRHQEFVLAAVALGYPTRRIIFEHILPNAVAPVLISATFGVASAILLESTLSFLGLGDVSAPSWGQTLAEGYASGAWHLILAPGFAIFVTVSLLNLVGEGLRDALDPKLRK